MKRSLIAAALALAAFSAASAHARARHHIPWCGLYMMKVKHKTDPRLAAAIQWAKEGINAFGPAIGVIVVWAHHVGEIVGGPNAKGQWLIHSGNDGNAVRTRYRSIRGVVAFRRV
jgi:hypothetical protein